MHDTKKGDIKPDIMVVLILIIELIFPNLDLYLTPSHQHRVIV